MAAALTFRVLGELQVMRDAAEVPLRTGKLRVVLATLLLRANRSVTVDDLIDCLWDGREPGGARTTAQTYVMRLRQALGDDTRNPELIRTRPGGYLLEVSANQLDLARFRGLVDQANELSTLDAAVKLHEALSLWQGDALAGVPSDSLRRDELPRLTEERLRILERRIDLDLRLGRHDDLIGELSALITQHPYRERFRGQLMLALFRAGRRADALDSYRDIRDLLETELGVAPGAELHRLHEGILRGDPGLAPAEVRGRDTAPATLAGPVRALPRQLPAPPRWFTGRTDELAALSSALDSEAESGTTMVISAIAGAGGIGKTWLALHWAHRHVDRFPDGQLFVDLHGFSPSSTPMDPATAVRGFLDALGVDPRSIPPDPHAQAALYRSLVADKRMLILADNARGAEQVIPLLPGSPTCTVVITSRNRLTELHTRHGAQLFPIDVLADDEARQVLRDRLGAERAAAEPDAVRDLVAWCAGFPLALGIMAGRAAAHPRFPLAVLAGELRDSTIRLNALDDDNPAASLPAVLSWSYLVLTPEQARAFALLGLTPGPDIGLIAAANLTDRTTPAAQSVLRALEDTHLVQQHAPDRWRMHDLIRLYAADRAEHDLSHTDREAASRRLVDFYLHTAFAADRLLAPSRPPIRLSAPGPDCRTQNLADSAAALAWFPAEHPNLVATQHLAARRGLHIQVWQLAWSLHNFLYRRGHLHNAIAVWQTALAAADHEDDPAIRILVHRHLGSAASAAARYGEATHHLAQALTLAEHLGDRSAQAQLHEIFALSWGRQRAHKRTLAHATRALRLYQDLNRPDREGRALNSVGFTQALLGDYDQARAHCEAALTLARRNHNRELEATTLDSLGFIAHYTGQHSRALNHYRHALTLYRNDGNTYGEADTLDQLGHAHHSFGQNREACAAWQQAVELYQIHHREHHARRVQRQIDALRVS